MNIVGSNLVPYPVEMVWDAILDPRVLVATIPGCERLVATGDNSYDMTVTAGVAAIKGTYLGSCSLSDLQDNESLVMRLTGAGAPGTIDATVRVFFGEAEPGVTEDRLRGGRRRRRHGRRRRAADADVGVEADGGGVLRQRRARRSVVPSRRPSLARPPSTAEPAARRCSPPRRRRSASAPRTTSSRASPSAPAWSCSGSSSGGCSAADERLGRLDRARPGRRRTTSRDLRARAARPAPRPDRRAQPAAQRDRVARRGACPRGCCGRRRAAGVRCRGRAAARAAVRVQGHPRGGRLAHDVRLPVDGGQRPRHRRAARRAGPARGRGHDRQDQRAGVRGRVAHVQHRLRHDAQPGRPDPVRRWFVGRRRVRARVRHGAARGRFRHGWLAAQPGVVLRRRGAAAVAGPGAGVAAVQPVGDHVGRRSDGPQRR